MMTKLKQNYPEIYRIPYTVISFSGQEAMKFLQGQLSCDLNEINGSGGLGLYCNRQGRIIADFFMTQQEGDYFLVMHESIAEETVAQMKQYAIFSKVDIAKLDWSVAYCFSQLSSNDLTLTYPEFHLVLNSTTAIPDPSKSWDLLQYCLKAPHIIEKTQNKFLPHRLNFHNSGHISFKKGCYLGQEIIARMHYKSEHQHRLYHISYSGKPLQPGEKLTLSDSHKSADIINTCEFEGKYYALISMVSTDLKTISQPLNVDRVITFLGA